MKIKFKILIVIAFFFTYAIGQERHGGKPLTFDIRTVNANGFKAANISLFSVANREYPVIDNEKELIKADSIAQLKGYEKNKFYGIGVPVNIYFKQAATVKPVGDSGKVYLLQLTSPTAYALQVYFDAFKIPKGSRMFIYDSNRTMYLGSFTNENNYVNNRFGTEFIKGNSLIIEYYEPNKVDFEAQLHIENLVHSFVDIKAGPFCVNCSGVFGADSCNINVNCPLGYGWDREKRSVALILGDYRKEYGDYNYYGWCSGTVINNTAQNGRPFFLSANHCIDSPMESTLDWLFLFNHEAQNCTDDGSSVSSYLGQSVYGALVLSKDGYCSPTSDYLLLELNTSAATLSSYGVVYAGWEADEYKAASSPYTVGIHHPSGDVKKISLDANPPVSVNHPSVTGCPNSGAISTYWKVAWDMGITECGSSGSPLFNSDHKIIGQLYAGSSNCLAPQNPDYYGKFSKSYTEGFFSLWLDPYFSGATSVGPYNPSQANEHCYNGIQDGNETGIDCGGDCPPCGWTSPISGGGWSSSHCYNGIKDEDETGIDCGGACKPCGGTQQCTNCIKDGDETGIDCGGSCIPCNSACTGINSTYTNTNIPDLTSVTNAIIAQDNAEIISGKDITFKAANEISLKPGFKANYGSTFKAIIAPCDCKQPCAVLYPNVFTPNGDGINDNYIVVSSGYNRYEIWVKNRWGQQIYHSTGTFTGNAAYLWNGAGTSSGSVYYAVIILYSDCLGISKTITTDINVFKSGIIKENESYTESLDSNIEQKSIPENIKIFPNPVTDYINIEYPFDKKPILYIVDTSGKTIYINSQLNKGITNIDMNPFPNGIYIVKLIDDNSIFTSKIIKK